MDSICGLLPDYLFDELAPTETWLTSNILDNELIEPFHDTSLPPCWRAKTINFLSSIFMQNCFIVSVLQHGCHENPLYLDMQSLIKTENLGRNLQEEELRYLFVRASLLP